MRLYHFLPACFALEDIEKRRIKLSEIDQLNDPFELWCVNQTDKTTRRPLREFKRKMAKSFALLCFTRHWKNPLLWSHYADKHKGICLGFDVPDNAVREIKYSERRSQLKIPLSVDKAFELIDIKYKGWSYEEEWRMWFAIEERDPISNFCFKDFGELVLREVIAGPLCNTPQSEIREKIRGLKNIKIIKSRLAFNSFSVVHDKRGFTRS